MPARNFPQTRYQGSKQKLVRWICETLSSLEFDTALDAFGGTGVVAYALKEAGKGVTYNDYLRCNQQIGLALIENDSTTVASDVIERVIDAGANAKGGGFIESTFGDIYYTSKENRWLDGAVVEIAQIEDPSVRAVVWSVLFQACIIKRPYNLFHRANLYMRTNQVKRSFGNKVTWDRSFGHYLRVFSDEFNRAIFQGEVPCQSLCEDVWQLPTDFDLVYLDPPYTNARGTSVDYHEFYHFLDGLLLYESWDGLLDSGRKHKPLAKRPNLWNKPKRLVECFEKTLDHFDEARTVALSYRADGSPPISELVSLMEIRGRRVQLNEVEGYQYALSGRIAGEVLILGIRP